MEILIGKTGLLLALLSIGLWANAQVTASKAQMNSDHIKLSLGIETGLGLGNFKDTHKSNIGATLQADLPVSDRFYANLNTGYVDFIGRDQVSGTGISAHDIHLLPVMAGLKYFPISRLYIQGDAGVAFALNKSELGYASTGAFVYVTQIGYQFTISGKSFLDAGVRYEGTSSYDRYVAYTKINQIGLRFAYGLAL
jgi:hypothetical protein